MSSEIHCATEVWLPCTLEEGMFTNEFAAQINIEGKLVSLFVDNSLIKKEGNETYLHVTLIGDNGKPHYKTVLLPSECFETGSRWLTIPERLLKAA